jgi:hypothetical protein
MARSPRFALSEEDRVITDGYAGGLPVAVIAQSLGVKPKRVAYRAQVLGLLHRSRNRTLEERFWGFVNPEPNTGCFLWSGALNRAGYGSIAAGGRNGSRRASHVAMELAGNPVPQGLFALHRCDNPACVNPEHIFFGRHLENVRDSRAKGRLAGTPLHRRNTRIDPTECLRGHLLTAENIYTMPTGGSVCRLCRNINAAKVRATRKANGLTSNGAVPVVVKARPPLMMECRRGHPLAGDNLYVRPDGKRCCRICRRKWQ